MVRKLIGFLLSTPILELFLWFVIILCLLRINEAGKGIEALALLLSARLVGILFD